MAAVEFVTIERLEQVLQGLASQIATGVSDAKVEMTGLITEAELRWQAKLAEHAEQFAGLGPAPSPPDTSAVDAKLRAQDAELQQLQQALSDLETQARRADTVTTALQTELQTITTTVTDRLDATTTTLTN